MCSREFAGECETWGSVGREEVVKLDILFCFFCVLERISPGTPALFLFFFFIFSLCYLYSTEKKIENFSSGMLLARY